MPDPLSPRAILDRLVAFPTVSRDTNLPLIDWVEAYLGDLGIPAHRHWNEDRSKAGLFAQVGPDVPGGVVLSGHSDVVPVDGQDWSSDPWVVTERDGRLYGRGTCDMKGFLALSLAALPLALRSGLRRPLQIAISYDEEVGCTGAPPLIAAMGAVLPRAAAVIVGEPSRMRVVTGHKGGCAWRVHVRGHEVHSSLLPQGVSAIMEGARLIDWANRRNAALMAATPGPVAAAFDPPHSTLHVGMIAGGTAHNITAGDCRFNLEVRNLPTEPLADWIAEIEGAAAGIGAAMAARVPGTGITLDRYFDLNGLAPEPGSPAEALARRLTGDNGTHVVSYGAEAGHFQAAGFPCVICGPGDIAQAHQADEYLEVAQFAEGWRFMERLVADLAA
jgi:acetylornithine deacetylase